MGLNEEQVTAITDAFKVLIGVGIDTLAKTLVKGETEKSEEDNSEKQENSEDEIDKHDTIKN